MPRSPTLLEPAGWTEPVARLLAAALDAPVWLTQGDADTVARVDATAAPPQPCPAGAPGDADALDAEPHRLWVPAGLGARARTLIGPLLASRARLWRALADGLTGLPARRLLIECLGDPNAGALLLIDLDGTRAINRLHGFEAGDAILAALAARIRVQAPAAALVVRHGGDELAVLLPAGDPTEAGALARQIVALPGADPDGLPARAGVTLSVGWAVEPPRLARAQAALAAARSAGGDRAVAWHADLPAAQVDGPRELLSGDWGRDCRNVSLLLETLAAASPLVEAQTLLARVVDATVELSDTERGLLFLTGDDGQPVCRVARDRTGRPLEEPLRYSTTVLARVLADGAPVTLAGEEAREWDAGQSIAELGLHTVLCLPIRTGEGGRVRGAVYVDGVRQSRFSASDLQFFEALAGQLGGILERARLQAEVEQLTARLRDRLADTEAALDRARAEIAGQYRFGTLVTRSPAMRTVLELMERVAGTDVAVLICGESGTGKELVARALHHNGPRADRAFVAENCGALSETLLESELFGHRKGAFTGATADRRGLLAEADGGTLLLDEIGEMSLGLQAKLLRFLQEGEYRPVGSDVVERADVRVLSATHRDLQADVAAGRFRADLYYRINVMQLRLPPLRERPEDIPQLLDELLARHAARQGRGCPDVDPAALERLMRHDWPGNVRELENQVQRALVVARDVLRPEHLAPELLDARAMARVVTDGSSLPDAVAAHERELIALALQAAAGNRSAAARRLGMPRTTLLDKLRRHGLD